MDKLCIDYQKQFTEKLIYDSSVFSSIDSSVKLHDEVKDNPLSSAASCLNVLGSLLNKPEELKQFLNAFNLDVSELIEFPSGANVDGLTYNDKGYVVFEWIGPKKSPINEKGGGRGQNRTSIDAFIIAKIQERITQIFIEWKFTEGKSRPLVLNRFSGYKGLERLRRYSDILIQWRNTDIFPFNFEEDNGIGLYDFSVDHLYQLLRMTLLAKTTTPIKIGDINIEDYRIVHLSHSLNDQIEILWDKYLTYSPGLKIFSVMKLYDVWRNILSNKENEKFKSGHWDTAIMTIRDPGLKEYLFKRYCIEKVLI